ncbi:MAG: cation:proton antiporter subunit C [Candidatus Aminicenantes bacterium]|nr:cation:proton antiporter subunit C [Candidatus Aminicenantes bacterium]
MLKSTLDFILGHYAYWFTFILLVIGLYGMMMKKNLVQKLIGMTIFQVSVIIFYIAGASKWGGTVPVIEESLLHAAHVQLPDPAHYINPLPHTLMLTAIVVGVATTGVAFALVISIYKRYKTLNEDALLKKMREDKNDDLTD